MTFDCYGTLVDWNGGMTAALGGIAGSRAPALLEAFRSCSVRLEGVTPHLRYRDVLVEGLLAAARLEEIVVPPSHADVLVEAWASLPVFPDAPGALERLRRNGWRVAVLTNCDDELFASTAPSLGVPLDEVVTAEQVRAYKPRLAHFEEFRRRSGAGPANWVHAANSWVLDITAAGRMGVPRVWVDRDQSGHDPALADAVTSDLSGIEAIVDALLAA